MVVLEMYCQATKGAAELVLVWGVELFAECQ